MQGWVMAWEVVTSLGRGNARQVVLKDVGPPVFAVTDVFQPRGSLPQAHDCGPPAHVFALFFGRVPFLQRKVVTLGPWFGVWSTGQSRSLPPSPPPSPPLPRSQTFSGLFGPGMMDRIGFGNLIPSFDAKEKKKNKGKKSTKWQKTRKNSFERVFS